MNNNSKIRWQVSLNPDFVGKIIDHLRSSGNGDLANELQYGNAHEGTPYRCRVCDSPMNEKDENHRCWGEEP